MLYQSVIGHSSQPKTAPYKKWMIFTPVGWMMVWWGKMGEEKGKRVGKGEERSYFSAKFSCSWARNGANCHPLSSRCSRHSGRRSDTRISNPDSLRNPDPTKNSSNMHKNSSRKMQPKCWSTYFCDGVEIVVTEMFGLGLEKRMFWCVLGYEFGKVKAVFETHHSHDWNDECDEEGDEC